jgi:hypothetical protein
MAPLLPQRRQVPYGDAPTGTTNISDSYYSTLVHTIIALSIISGLFLLTTLVLFRFWHKNTFGLLVKKPAAPSNPGSKPAAPPNPAATRVETHHFVLDGGKSERKKKTSSRHGSSRSRESPKEQKSQPPSPSKPADLPAVPQPITNGPPAVGWNNPYLSYPQLNYGGQQHMRPKRGPEYGPSRVEELDQDMDDGFEEEGPISYRRSRPGRPERRTTSGRGPRRNSAFDTGRDNDREGGEAEEQADPPWGGEDGIVGLDEQPGVNEGEAGDDGDPRNGEDAGQEGKAVSIIFHFL